MDFKLQTNVLAVVVVVVVHIVGVRLGIRTAATNRPIVHTPGDI
jgi:hypothetical protein